MNCVCVCVRTYTQVWVGGTCACHSSSAHSERWAEKSERALDGGWEHKGEGLSECVCVRVWVERDYLGTVSSKAALWGVERGASLTGASSFDPGERERSGVKRVKDGVKEERIRNMCAKGERQYSYLTWVLPLSYTLWRTLVLSDFKTAMFKMKH